MQYAAYPEIRACSTRSDLLNFDPKEVHFRFQLSIVHIAVFSVKGEYVCMKSNEVSCVTWTSVILASSALLTEAVTSFFPSTTEGTYYISSCLVKEIVTVMAYAKPPGPLPTVSRNDFAPQPLPIAADNTYYKRTYCTVA